MSSPREGWWGYARWVVRQYPARLRELEEIRQGSGKKDGGGKSSRTPRPTENLALRELPPARQKELDAVTLALDTLSLRSDPERRRELVRLVFWAQTHTLSGAAYRLHIGYETAKRWQQQFLRDVARGLGVAD